MEGLPAEWGEMVLRVVNHEEGGARSERELGFSRRVGERRRELAMAAAVGRRGFGADDGKEEEMEDTLRQLPEARGSNSVVGGNDPTTPRCSHRALPHAFTPFTLANPLVDASASITSSSSSYFAHSDPLPTHHDLSSSFASSSTGTGSNPAFLTLQHSTALDPFHLPSLLHLVGLNIRLSLLPAAQVRSGLRVAEEGEKSDSDNVKSTTSRAGRWVVLGLGLGVVFLAGVVAGVGVGGGAVGWRGIGGLRVARW